MKVVPVAVRKRFAECKGHLVAPYYLDAEAAGRARRMADGWRADGMEVEKAADVGQVAVAGLVKATAGASTTVVMRFYDGESFKCVQTLASDLREDTVRITPIYSSSDHRIGLIEVLVLPRSTMKESTLVGPGTNDIDLSSSRGGDRVYIFNGDSKCTAPLARACGGPRCKKPRHPMNIVEQSHRPDSHCRGPS